MTATLTTRLSVNTKENFLVRIGLIERALKINPNYPVGLEREVRYRARLVAQAPARVSNSCLSQRSHCAPRRPCYARKATGTRPRPCRARRSRSSRTRATAIQKWASFRWPSVSTRTRWKVLPKPGNSLAAMALVAVVAYLTRNLTAVVGVGLLSILLIDLVII